MLENNQLDMCNASRFLDGFLKLLFGGVLFKLIDGGQTIRLPEYLQNQQQTWFHVLALSRIFLVV